jgi:hypothetical protein
MEVEEEGSGALQGKGPLQSRGVVGGGCGAWELLMAVQGDAGVGGGGCRTCPEVQEKVA